MITLRSRFSSTERTDVSRRRGARILTAVAVSATLSLPAGLALGPLAASAATAKTSQTAALTPEQKNLNRLNKVVAAWQAAIAKKNVKAATTAGETYEITWQGVEVYVNYRSLALYTDTETDTQFVMDDDLTDTPVPWTKLRRLGRHLAVDIKAAQTLADIEPRLSPMFEDLSKVRAVRAYINAARTHITAGDIPGTQKFLNVYAAKWPAVQDVIAFRSAAALQEINAQFASLQALFATPSTPLATLQSAVTSFQSKLGFGVNLINAAARAWDKHRLALSDTDRTVLTSLNTLQNNLKSSAAKFPADPTGCAAGGATDATSVFAKVQPALEAQYRQINTMASLRTALLAFATLCTQTPTPSATSVATAARAAQDQIDIARQVLVGQFWGTPALTTFLASLPAS